MKFLIPILLLGLSGYVMADEGHADKEEAAVVEEAVEHKGDGEVKEEEAAAVEEDVEVKEEEVKEEEGEGDSKE